MPEEELLELVRNQNTSDEQLIKLAFMLLSEVYNKKKEQSTCYLCGGNKLYMGVDCGVCQ